MLLKKEGYFMSMKKNAQSLIEYGLILALVAVVAVTILGKFSSSINKVGEQANTAVNNSGDNAMNSYCGSLNPVQHYDAATGKCAAGAAADPAAPAQ